MRHKRDFAFRTYAVILLGVLGALVGLVIFLYGSPASPESLAFMRSPEFITWVFINEVLFALSPILLAFLWPGFRQREDVLRSNWREIFTATLLLLGMFQSVLLSLFIFASAALRAAAIAFGSVKPENYPSNLLVVIGAFHSLLIALIYLPAYITLLNAGKRLLNAFYPLQLPGSDAWDKTYTKRKELEDFLELKVAPEQRLATTITLLAPFVSSVFSFLVNK